MMLDQVRRVGLGPLGMEIREILTGLQMSENSLFIMVKNRRDLSALRTGELNLRRLCDRHVTSLLLHIY